MEYTIFSNLGSREINEDYADIFRAPTGIVFVLADGLGGHGGGEIASKTAVETVKKVFQNNTRDNVEVVLQEAFENAHNMLKKLQNEVKEENFFKTTLVVLVVRDNEFIWANIGDSRLYHFEKNILVERSMDHSVTQMLVNSGAIKEKKIRFHEDRSRLTKVLGAEEETSKPFISKREPLTDNSSFLLCTDGFWELIWEKDMVKTLKKTSNTDEWLEMMKETVVKNGKKKKMDNYSAIAVKL